MQPPVLKAESVTKKVSSPEGTLTILAEVDLQIAAGETVAIVGASGAGKSTLLALLAGLDEPTAGKVWLNGSELTALDEDGRAAVRARHVGFVFQSFHLVPSLTAIENVMLPLELAGLPNARNSAAEVLAQVNLSPRREHYPRQLSGGEQQRVAIARAFVTRPAVLFADEPTGNLDSVTGERIIELLFDLNKATQTTLVVVTHDEAIARRCSRIIKIEAGRLVVVIKALRLALLALLRDGKSGELRVLMLALLVAVSALTAVGFFTSRVSLAVDQQAGEVLAADLRLQSRAPIEREYFDLATAAGLDHGRDLDVPERRVQRRRQRAHCDSRRVRALSLARAPEGCRCAVRPRARSHYAAGCRAKRGSNRGCSVSSTRASAIASASGRPS